MSDLLKKRSRDDESRLASVKRFHGETEKQVLYFLEDIESADKLQDAERYSLSEELVREVMRSLEKEIGITSCSTSFELAREDYVARHITNETHSGIVLDYLLGASDDELGIPPSVLQNLEDQSLSSSPNDKKIPFSLDFAENAQHKGFVDNWDFEDNFVEYTEFDAAAFDTLRKGASIDGDYSALMTLDTGGFMY